MFRAPACGTRPSQLALAFLIAHFACLAVVLPAIFAPASSAPRDQLPGARRLPISASCGADGDARVCLERASHPLHGRRIDPEPGRRLAHTQSARTGGKDSLLQLVKSTYFPYLKSNLGNGRFH
jgi:hypothetical protein